MSNNEKTTNQKLSELHELVAWFENDTFELEEALEKFEQGTQLAAAIKKDLSDMENKITVLKEKFSA